MSPPIDAAVRLDFVGVGAAKSATSWLASALAQHPEICLAEPKELNYFCDTAIWPGYRVNRSLGPQWLAQRFIPCRPDQKRGEFSPNYLCDPHSPSFLYAHNPKCRLLFSFRHPVEAVASYHHQVRKEAPVPGDLETFLERYPTVRALGLYHQHVRRFLDLFPREQCLFLFFEDVQHRPADVLRQSFQFLGVDPEFVPAHLDKPVNRAERPRSRMLMNALNQSRLFLQRHAGDGTQRLLWTLKIYRLHAWLLRRNLQPFTPPPIDSRMRQRLLDFYRSDTCALGELLGKDLARWET